jgi:hypothetical protein
MNSFFNIKVKIVVNDKLNFFQKLLWKFKELSIKTAIYNKSAKGTTIEEVLKASGILKSDKEYFTHTSIFPQKYEVRDKDKDQKAKEEKKRYIPRIIIFIKFEVK